MTQHITFRRVLPDECGQARSALQSCGRDDWSAAEDGYPGCMLSEDITSGAAWGLYDDEGLAAYGVLALSLDEEYASVEGVGMSSGAVIHRLYTAGRAQRRGLGARMVEELAGLARDKGARCVYVDMLSGVPGLEEFYLRCGFERQGEFEREGVGRFLLLGRAL